MNESHSSLRRHGACSVCSVMQTTAPTGTRLLADVSLALGGAAVTGFLLAMPEGPPAMLMRALSLAVITLGTTAVMLPPLYIAATTFGVAPPAAAFLQCASAALRTAGIVLLGLAPPLAFLIATSNLLESVWLLGNAAAALAALLGVRSLWYSLFLAEVPGSEAGARAVMPRRPMFLYLLWLAVGASITASLFQKTFE